MKNTKLKFIFIIFFLCVGLCLGICTSVQVPVELQAVESCLKWVLGTERRSSAGTVQTLNHWAIFPTPKFKILSALFWPQKHNIFKDKYANTVNTKLLKETKERSKWGCYIYLSEYSILLWHRFPPNYRFNNSCNHNLIKLSCRNLHGNLKLIKLLWSEYNMLPQAHVLNTGSPVDGHFLGGYQALEK